MCHNGANRTERGARGSESGIGAAAQALVQGSAWGFVRGSARGCAGVCRGMRRRRVCWNRAGCGTTAGESVAGGGVLRREGYRDGGRTGRSGGRGGGTKGCGGGCGELRMVSCAVAAGVVASGKECFGGRNAWGLPVLLRYGRRMDVEELTGRRGFCPRGGLSRWKADGAQRRKGRS